MKKKNIILALFILALLIRLFGIMQPLYDGEADMANFDGYFNSKYFLLHSSQEKDDYSYFVEANIQPTRPHHPPLSVLLYGASWLLFGPSAASFRLVSILFGIAGLYFIYLIAEFLYNEKIALYSLVLAAFAFWHILASLQVGQHGALIIVFSLGAFYYFLRYEKWNKTKDFVISAVFLSLAFLTTYLAFILILVILVYYLLGAESIKNIKKRILNLIPYFLISFALFSLFPIISYFTNFDIFLRTILGSGHVLSFIPSMRVVIFLMIWAGPLLLSLALLSLTKHRKEDNLFIITIIIFLLISIFTKSYASLDRYLMVIIPSLCILSGKFLAELRLNKKLACLFIITFAVFYIILLGMNLKGVDYLPHDLSGYIDRVKNLDFNFYFPITGPVGPTFGLSFSSIILPAIISAALFVLSLILIKNKKAFSILVMALIGVSFAFNAIITQEFLFNTAHPDISKIRYELIDYYRENKLAGNLYSNDLALWYYLDKKSFRDFYLFNDITLDELDSLIKTERGTIMVTQFPRIAEDSRLWQLISQCSLSKEFSSKNIVIGYVFYC